MSAADISSDEIHSLNVIPPSGDVTLMFTDIEGSTKSWDKYQDTFRLALNVHNTLMREAIRAHGGFEVKTIGDSFMVAFADPVHAVNCALDMQRHIERGDFESVGGMRVRIGLHCGGLEPYGGDYFGPVVNHAARIESSAHGGQVVVSEGVAAVVAAADPGGVNVRDAGLHGLKDLGAPIRLFLITAEDLPQRDYPRLRTLDPTAHNFPAQLTSFVGRERETVALLELLRSQKRLITLTGPGGTGKTRLSMQVAAEAIQDYRDGVWLVELASVTDAREVPSAIALALKIALAPEKPIPEQVFDYLKEKKCLLVVDNFEQVIDAAACISTLLKRCPHVVCLVTSQHLLQISGEVEYPLAPLSLPPPNVTLEEAFHNPSVQLFVERAQAARAQFALSEETLPAVVEICRQLDGSPLALELTAALVRGMTPLQILPRLKDRFKLLASSRRDLDPRQRSLRGALDWSYELLTEEERSLFAEVSVFVGGFRMEDLEAISDAPDALFLAFALRDKSLLKADEAGDDTRYRMLESIRLYAAEKLRESGRSDQLNERHALRYLEIAKELGDQLHSSGEAMQRMTVEIDNLRVGMDWAIEQEDTEQIAAYGRPLARFFLARGLHDESDRRLALGEAVCRAKSDTSSLAQILLHRGNICEHRSEVDRAKQFWTESLAIYQSLEDRPRMVALLGNLGNIAWRVSDYSSARQRWEEALELTRNTGQLRYEAMLESNLGIIASEQGRFQEAVQYLDHSLSIHKQMGYQLGVAYAIFHYAGVLYFQSDFAGALKMLEESRALFEKVEYQPGIVLVSVTTGQALIEVGNVDAADTLVSEALIAASQAGDKRCEMLALDVQSLIVSARNRQSEAKDLLRKSARIALDLKDHKHLATVMWHYGKLLVLDGELEDAIQFLNAAYREYKDKNLHGVAAIEADLLKLYDSTSGETGELPNEQISDAEHLYARLIQD